MRNSIENGVRVILFSNAKELDREQHFVSSSGRNGLHSSGTRDADDLQLKAGHLAI
jgi:hypothetical protein